jgi:hypothetical protein
VICVTIKQSYNRGCTIAGWLRRSLLARKNLILNTGIGRGGVDSAKQKKKGYFFCSTRPVRVAMAAEAPED